MGDVIQFAPRKRAAANATALADDAYRKGCELDEFPGTWEAAKAAYQEALRHDPRHARSLCNLANLLFQQGLVDEAEAMYMRATTVTDRVPAEVHYNLGFILSERSEWGAAIDRFKTAIAIDPDFADAHFNLAMSFTMVNQYLSAQPHWERYLSLDPDGGEWTDMARRHQQFAKKHLHR